LLTQVLALGFTQTIAWAASTYLIAILAAPIARDLGLTTSTVFGAFSVALVVMALTGPYAGRAIDRFGGRRILVISNFVLAAGLVMLGYASGTVTLFLAWCVLGFGMALGLYEAAFAALVRIHGAEARAPITGITLIAGFASTVGWPVTALLAEHYGWRASCFAWAAVHLAIALPINVLCIPPGSQRAVDATPARAGDGSPVIDTRTWQNYWRSFVLLALFGATTSFVTSAMAAHLPGLLLAVGTSAVAALTASALLGPAQVAARLTEFIAARRFRFHPLVTARIATACHPVAGVVLAFFGGPAAAASFFSMMHGAGNGMITIAKGTLPLAIFGPVGYGHRQGLLSVLGRGMQAIAPFAFGVVLEQHGPRLALALSVALSLVALASLMALRRPTEEPPQEGL
jgi:MFS family permease